MILFQGKYLANGKIRGGNIYGGEEIFMEVSKSSLQGRE